MNGKDNVTDFVLKYIDKWDEQTDKNKKTLEIL